jgi:hypothetical protein
MKTPTGCALWKEPERVVAGGLQSGFKLLETFVHESHWWRYLLKCRECGQLYVYEFYEEVDWVDGEDPQFTYWVPVETETEIASLRTAPAGGLAAFAPRLCKDWPKGAKEAKLYWVKNPGR